MSRYERKMVIKPQKNSDLQTWQIKALQIPYFSVLLLYANIARIPPKAFINNNLYDKVLKTCNLLISEHLRIATSCKFTQNKKVSTVLIYAFLVIVYY